MARASAHREPVGARNIAQHYLRDLVYGANDGIVTTFAVVAGVAGGALSARAVLIVGAGEPGCGRSVDGRRQLPRNSIQRKRPSRSRAR